MSFFTKFFSSMARKKSTQKSVTIYDVARVFLGIKEISGPVDHPLIMAALKLTQSGKFTGWPTGDETAWCSAFVNLCAFIMGIKPAALNARSWQFRGKRIENIKDARKGDVVVLWRVSRTSKSGHVAFYVKHDRTHVWLLGGNQSDEINVTKYPISRIVAINRIDD